MGEQLPCHEKHRYRTPATARRSLRGIRRNGEHREGGKKPTRAYACPHCRGWHLTSRDYDGGWT